MIFSYYINYDTQQGGRGWQIYSKCKNTLKPLLGAYLLIRKKNVIFQNSIFYPDWDKKKLIQPKTKGSYILFQVFNAQ